MNHTNNQIRSKLQVPSSRSLRPAAKIVGASLPLLMLLLFLPLLGQTEELALEHDWKVRSSAEVKESGEKISLPSFDARGWYSTTVPSTVLAALRRNGLYPDLYFGRNLETVSYDSFRVSWWYRKEFDLSLTPSLNTHLIFDGINYSANVYLNGKQIATADSISGAYRRFDLNITSLVRSKRNFLAVQVFPPKAGDYTIGFVDWNPPPPDRNMGIFREVKLRTSGSVMMQDPYVRTRFASPSLQEARLTVGATLLNHSRREVSGKITVAIDGGPTFTRPYSLGPAETSSIHFDSQEIAELVVRNPRVWWPTHLGKPELYTLNITVRTPTGISDSQRITFGVREVADYLNEHGHRGYIVNGKKILIRGAGWVDDLLLEEDDKKLEAQFQYAKHLNLNLVRLEGFWGSSQKLYDLADRYGLLLMVGVSCQWEWKDYLGKETDENYGGAVTKEDQELLARYFRDQVVWLRNHPSILVWALASDMLPHPDLEKRYRDDLREIDPTRPALSATKGYTSTISGPNGVKMNGPYEYVTPNYWYIDKENGGAFGFDTEVSPGAQPPPMESIQRMFAKEHYWPVDETWNFHSGRNEFNTMAKYLNALNKRYGEAENLEEFAMKSQAVNYEGIRAMFESFGVRKPVATGVVQWMLNGAWPKMFWQLYDYYLMPGGAFYGARKANLPLNIAYDYGKRAIHVVNNTYSPYQDLNLELKVMSIDSKLVLTQTHRLSVAENESKKIFDLPDLKGSPVHFLSLKLKDLSGKIVADNFYWLSARQDVPDFKATEWFYTPTKEFADFTSLKTLPPVTLQVTEQWGKDSVNVELKNPSPHVAFLIELKVTGNRTGRSVLPVFWDDNYVSLLPGETRQLTARFSRENLAGENLLLQYSGWNVKSGILKSDVKSALKRNDARNGFQRSESNGTK